MMEKQFPYPAISSGKETFMPLSFSEEKFEFLWMMRPGGAVFPHVHEESDEHFEIIEGNPVFTIDGRIVRTKPGDKLIVPKNTAHKIRNGTKGEIKCVVSYRPASDQGRLFEIALWLLKENPAEKIVLVKAFYIFEMLRFRHFSSPVKRKKSGEVIFFLIRLGGSLMGWKKLSHKYRRNLVTAL